MMIPSSLYKILSVILLFFISTLPVQALSFPSTQPTGEISGGKFNQILTNIFLDCGAGNYIQGFTSTGVADCKSVANFSTLTLAVGHPNTISGAGLFQKYFTKILSDCGTGRYIRGFDSNKNLICEDTAQAVTLMGTSVSLVSPVSVSFPPPPVGQSPGGTFTDSFSTLFSVDCGTGKYLQGFDASKNKICAPIVTAPASNVCGTTVSVGGSSYNTVSIGGQCWTASNMRHGTMLINSTTLPSNNSIVEKWCYSDNNCTNNATGALYTWAEAMNLDPSCNTSNTGACNPTGTVQGICPSGWHMPSDMEYMILVESQAMAGCDASDSSWNCSGAATKLASSSNWASTPLNAATNISGFSVLPSGMRNDTGGGYYNLNSTAFLWSSSPSTWRAFTAYTRYFASSLSQVNRGEGVNKASGASVRCLKDSAPVANMISDCTQLQNIGTNATNLSGSYRLAKDIDCSATSPSNPANAGSIWDNGGLGFKPIGDQTTPFNGTFDGKGYKITGLYINRPLENFIGLFGATKNGNIVIKNIGVDSAIIKGRGYTSGLVGWNYSSSPITNSYITNSVINGTLYVGGLVGYNSFASISNSFSTRNTVTASIQSGGGLVGYNDSLSSIIYSFAANDTVISGTYEAGGLVGLNGSNSPISNSYAVNNTVMANSTLAGGLIGQNMHSPVSNSYAVNNIVSGTNSVGGFIGSNNSASISNSYATNNSLSGTSLIGGFVGDAIVSTITSSYYSKDTFTGATLYGIGKTTAEMITQGTYTGWDFSAAWKPMSALTGYYPCLAWQSVGSCMKPNTYPGCDTTDITLSNGQVWAACNIGSTIAGTSTGSYGTFHQWGRNDGGWTSNPSGVDWQTQNDNSWGGGTTTSTVGTWTTVSNANQTLMKGPCVIGYHVPTSFEWITAVNFITGKTSASGWMAADASHLQTTLKLPMPGYRNSASGLLYVQGLDGFYWSSSPESSYAYGSDLHFNSSTVSPTGADLRADGFSIRCMKN